MKLHVGVVFTDQHVGGVLQTVGQFRRVYHLASAAIPNAVQNGGNLVIFAVRVAHAEGVHGAGPSAAQG